MSVNLKQKEKFTLRWMYPGPVGTILADTNEHAEVRGFPQRLRLVEQVSTLEAAMGGDGRMSAITSVPERVMHTGTQRDTRRPRPQWCSQSRGPLVAVVAWQRAIVDPALRHHRSVDAGAATGALRAHRRGR